jgi:hypothetical protein
MTAAIILSYNRTSWDNPGTNPIEQVQYNSLSANEYTAAQILGYTTPLTWDCWQNHYTTYNWTTLGDTYIQVVQWYEILGWDALQWDNDDDKLVDVPLTDGMTWYELRDNERYAAAQLCYTQRTWDSEIINGRGYGGFPGIRKPNFRYTDWYTVDENVRTVATSSLGYTPLTWNVIGLHTDIESLTWDKLQSNEIETSALSTIGYTKTTWDCFINHFRGYSWYDLTFYGLDLPLITLGWTEAMWDAKDPISSSMMAVASINRQSGILLPDTVYKSWDSLTEIEQVAARELCYFIDSWDMTDMTPNLSPFPYPKVKQRYVEWNSLPSDVRHLARTSLLYDKTTWDTLGSASIERRMWMELTAEQQSHAILIGFYQRTWDCFQNHYRAYSWDDFDTLPDIKDALKTLGWLRDTWTGVGGVEPQSYNMPWLGLNATEQAAATTLCFFEDIWNERTLQSVEVGLVESSADLLDPRNIVWLSISVLVLSCIYGSFVQYY